MSFFKTITTKPWEKKGVIGGLDPEGAINAPNEKVALSVFLVVISVVFSLFTVGYFLRMELPDWQPFLRQCLQGVSLEHLPVHV